MEPVLPLALLFGGEVVLVLIAVRVLLWVASGLCAGLRREDPDPDGPGGLRLLRGGRGPVAEAHRATLRPAA